MAKEIFAFRSGHALAGAERARFVRRWLLERPLARGWRAWCWGSNGKKGEFVSKPKDFFRFFKESVVMFKV